jgi:glycosyltransferase involved in cell wall biosynthesis
LRILLVSSVWPPASAPEGDHAAAIAVDLAAFGHRVDVLTTRGVVARPESVRVHPVVKDWTWSDLPRVFARIVRIRPDVVLLMYLGWLYRHHPMVTALPRIARWVRPRTAFVTLVSYVTGSRWNEQAQRIAARITALTRTPPVDPEFGTILTDSDAVVVPGPPFAARLRDRFPEAAGRIFVVQVPCLIPVAGDRRRAADAARSSLRVPADAFVFIFFGYLYPPKNVDTLLHAFASVAARVARDAYLLIVGGTLTDYDGSVAYGHAVKKLAHELGITDRVRWVGPFAWDSEEPSACLFASDAAVFPPEGGISTGNSAVVAAACHGLPIIATSGQWTTPPFVAYETALLFPRRDVEALAALLEEVIVDGSLRERLAHGAAQLAAQFFGRRPAAKAMEDVMRLAVARRLTVNVARRSANE